VKKENLEILLEDISGKFDLVLEGHQSLHQEIREARDESNGKHEETAFLLQALNEKIDKVDERLDKKIDNLEERLDKKIDNLEERLDKKIDNLGERLDEKIDSVEMSLGQKIDAVAADLSEHRKDTEAHTGYRVCED